AAQRAIGPQLFEQILGLIAKQSQPLIQLLAALLELLAVEVRQAAANLLDRFLKPRQCVLGGLLRLVRDELAAILQRSDRILAEAARLARPAQQQPGSDPQHDGCKRHWQVLHVAFTFHHTRTSSFAVNVMLRKGSRKSRHPTPGTVYFSESLNFVTACKIRTKAHDLFRSSSLAQLRKGVFKTVGVRSALLRSA